MFKILRFSQNVRLCFHNCQHKIKLFNYCTDNKKLNLPGLNPDVNVNKLTNNNTDQLKKLQLILLEADIMRQEGLKVPEPNFLTQNHWEELLIKSRSQRKKYLVFLWKIEKKKENLKSKKEKLKIERENRPEQEPTEHIRYGLNNNTFFIRIYDTTINNLYNSKLINAHIYNQPLIIDVGYDKQMTSRECKNCAKQIMLAFSENRINSEPFDLHLCNANLNSTTIQSLSRHIATLFEPWFPLSVHNGSYLTATFPSIDIERKNGGKPPLNLEERKKKLVYLTPHCREVMTSFDHSAIYIIGGIVDKVNQEPLSLAKAKSEGLKMQKLPLDKYLSWGSGSGKSLTINQMILILLDLKTTGNWDYALRHVPKRKVLNPYNISRTSENYSLPYDKNKNVKLSNRYNTDFLKDLMKN